MIYELKMYDIGDPYILLSVPIGGGVCGEGELGEHGRAHAVERYRRLKQPIFDAFRGETGLSPTPPLRSLALREAK